MSIMKRFIGQIFWIKWDQHIGTTTSGNFAKVKRAILKDNVLTVDHKNPENIPDSEIKLRFKDGFKFDGSAKYVDSPKYSAMVNLKYYFNNDKALLIGDWKEDEIEFLCMVKLEEVESFQD